jgi:hypothetical protein
MVRGDICRGLVLRNLRLLLERCFVIGRRVYRRPAFEFAVVGFGRGPHRGNRLIQRRISVLLRLGGRALLRLSRRGGRLASPNRFRGECLLSPLAVTIALTKALTFAEAVAGSGMRVVAGFLFLPYDWGLRKLTILVRSKLILWFPGCRPRFIIQSPLLGYTSGMRCLRLWVFLQPLTLRWMIISARLLWSCRLSRSRGSGTGFRR